MKYFKFFVVLGIALGLAVYGYSKATAPALGPAGERPQIEVVPETFDFGEIEYGEVARQVFEVRNLGDQVLEIKKLSTSCGCTTAEVTRERILPGEGAELKVAYDSGAMSGNHAKGKQERTIYIKSNDPVNPQVEVMIYANVK